MEIATQVDIDKFAEPSFKKKRGGFRGGVKPKGEPTVVVRVPVRLLAAIDELKKTSGDLTIEHEKLWGFGSLKIEYEYPFDV
jgi:hypothetical protein